MRWLIALILCCAAMPAVASAPFTPPALAAHVGIDQKLGAALPADVYVIDATGRKGSWADWIQDKPALLMLGYFTCPNLCDVMQQGLLSSLHQSGLQPGRDVNVLFLSIDPNDTPSSALAAQRRSATSAEGESSRSWHYLMGSKDAISKTAAAIGYRFWYDPQLRQYAHPAGLVVITPQGKVSQYLMGVSFAPQTLRVAVASASHGTLGTIVDQLVLFCCGYDPTTGRYTLTIHRVMLVAGSVFVALLALAMGWLWRSRRPVRA